jgi:hypothetical protein
MESILRPLLIGLSSLSVIFTSTLSAQEDEFGWRPMANTKLEDYCPPNGLYDYSFSYYCKNVIYAWSGGDLDPATGKMYIWGGGHIDYYGNELYVLDAINQTMQRLTEPGLKADPDSKPAQSELEPFNGTQPNSRHTYDGVSFMQESGLLWAFSGGLAGRFSPLLDNLTWLFNPANNSWSLDNAKGDIPPPSNGVVSAYDTETGKVFLHNRQALYSYEYHPDGGTYTLLNSNGSLGLGLNAAIDPVNRIMLIIGDGQQYIYELTEESGYRRIVAPLKGDADFIKKHDAPGLTYNSKDGHFYAWPGNGKLYRFNSDEMSWQSLALSNDPGPQASKGTFGRFAYLESVDSFVLVHSPVQNAYLLKLPEGEDTEAPTAPADFNAKYPYPGAVSLTWQPSEDNFGVAGYKVMVNGEQVAEQLGTEYKSMAYKPGETLNIQVQAFDSAGNHSPLSAPQNISLPASQAKMRLGDCSKEPRLAERDDIVFCEPWEDENWWQTGKYLRDPVVDDPRPMRESSVAYAELTDENCIDGKCLKVKMEKDKNWALSAFWPLKNANLAPDNLYMRYYLKLSDDWDINMCKANGDISGAGGKFPGLADVRTWADPGGQCGNGGASSDGINCWSMRLNYRNCESNDGEACATKPEAAMRLGSYLYHPLQSGSTGSAAHWDGDDWSQAKAGECDSKPGNLFCGKGDGGVLERGLWYQIEMQVGMNTPGQADGVIRGWVNGQLSYEKTNMVFRNKGHDFLHNRLAWFNIYKGGLDGNCSTSHVYLDQMVIALDQPIGGVDSSTELPPTMNLTVTPEQPTENEPVTVAWASENAQSCQASGIWEGHKNTQGEEVIGPFSESGIVRLDCEGSGGKVARQATILVNGNPIEEDRTDTTITRPSGLQVTELTDAYLKLEWDEAPEQENIETYRVLLNNVLLDEVTEPYLTVQNLVPGVTLEYRVQAVNNEGFMSAPSEPLSVEVPDNREDKSKITLYPSSDTYLASSTFKSLGQSTQLSLSGGRNILLKFPVELLGTDRVRIRKATLTLTPKAQYGNSLAELHLVAKDWHEDQASRDYADRSAKRKWVREIGDWLDKNGDLHGDEPRALIELPDTNATEAVQIDITWTVRGWLDDSENLGVLLKMRDGRTHNFHSKESADPETWPRLDIELD